MANPNDSKPKASDAGSPLTSGSPEQFGQEVPAHLAAQGDKAPPMPNARVRRYFRVHDRGGVMLPSGPADANGRIPRALSLAGSVVTVDEERAKALAAHPELTEVDANGQPLQTDRIASRQTGEATVPQKR